MANNLKGLKVAILIEKGFEQVEMNEPRKALDEAGAQTSIVSPNEGKVRGWKFKEWGDEFPVDKQLDDARPEDYDALLAGEAKGRRIASWPSVKTDLKNAGAEWVDQEVVVDGKLVSSRKPDDIPAFNREMLRVFESARPQAQRAAK